MIVIQPVYMVNPHDPVLPLIMLVGLFRLRRHGVGIFGPAQVI
jgi:hypothetical protein